MGKHCLLRIAMHANAIQLQKHLLAKLINSKRADQVKQASNQDILQEEEKEREKEGLKSTISIFPCYKMLLLNVEDNWHEKQASKLEIELETGWRKSEARRIRRRTTFFSCRRERERDREMTWEARGWSASFFFSVPSQLLAMFSQQATCKTSINHTGNSVTA